MIYQTIALGHQDATLTPICVSNTAELKLTPRQAVIVCPGGGYGALSDREAEPIATQFLAAGFATFILRYSVGEGAKDYAPLKQVALAIKHVREHAPEYHIDPDRIFTCGFSAGGHLAASAGVLWNSPVLADIQKGAPEGINRPNGMILCYPVITAGEWAHKGSIHRLCGTKTPTKEEENRFSLELHVNETTPPAFIWHTFNDNCVPVQNALLMAEAMTAAKVPFELHIFPNGPHGLALCNEQTAKGSENLLNPHCACWVELAIKWAKEL
ncbi:MAG: alpha/beta hydrolase [Ruminococcaceae bacterium]|nr:alpha/beta hydrolase [Oscillospiraceae bacterium]